LKTNLIESEYIIEIEKQRKIYENINKNNHSRGYSGYLTIHNNKHFCRSQAEYIHLLNFYLNIYTSPKYKIKTECEIYHVNKLNYKPDIFIYKDNELIKIYEIKAGKIKNKELLKKYTIFKKYFKTLNIEFEILTSYAYILKQYPNIKENVNEWKNNIATIQIDTRGENNPRYGIKCSEQTKKLIGEKAKKRCEDPLYRKKIGDAIKETYKNNPEIIKKLSEKAKERSRKNQEKYNNINPIINKNCIMCGKEFKDRQNNDKKTCSSGCTLKYNLQTGKTKRKTMSPERVKKVFKNKLVNASTQIFTHYPNIEMQEFLIEIKKLKSQKIIPKNLGISEDTINKYFNNFNQFKQYYYGNKKNNTLKAEN